MRLRSLALLTASLALAGTALTGTGLTGTGPAAANADPDTTAPRVHLSSYALPVVGSQVDIVDTGEGWVYWWSRIGVRWSARDASGICEQEVGWSGYESMGADIDPRTGGPTEYFAVPLSERRFTAHSDTFNWNRGPDRFIVKVADCEGNTAYSNVADTEFGIQEDTSPEITYRGRWRTAHFEEFSFGTTHATVVRGATASITFPGSRPISLVMETAPNRGKAAVYVDGRYQGTIDTYSAETRHRVVTWSRTYGPGTHTLRLVNLATPGHPRIDLDAISVCTPTSLGDCLPETGR